MTELQELKLNRIFNNLFSSLRANVGMTGVFYILPSNPYKYCILIPHDSDLPRILLSDIIKYIKNKYGVEKTFEITELLLKAFIIHFNIKKYVIED